MFRYAHLTVAGERNSFAVGATRRGARRPGPLRNSAYCAHGCKGNPPAKMTAGARGRRILGIVGAHSKKTPLPKWQTGTHQNRHHPANWSGLDCAGTALALATYSI